MKRRRRHPPELPIYTILVRPVGDRMVYCWAIDRELNCEIKRLPNGKWSRVPVLPDTMKTIKSGDLEKKIGSEKTVIGLKRPSSRVAIKGGAEPPARAPECSTTAVATAGKKPKPDKAGALAEVAARVAAGEKKRAVCKEVWEKYHYDTQDALERACRPDRRRKGK